MKGPSFALVLAESQNGHGIGFKGGLPWPKMPKELAYFRSLTLDSICIMGRKTYESLGSRPLPKRINIVVSGSLGRDIKGALTLAALNVVTRKIFIIGGASLFNQAQKMEECKEIFLTTIEKDYECDIKWDGVDLTMFIEDETYTQRGEENGIAYVMRRYVRK